MPSGEPQVNSSKRKSRFLHILVHVHLPAACCWMQAFVWTRIAGSRSLRRQSFWSKRLSSSYRLATSGICCQQVSDPACYTTLAHAAPKIDPNLWDVCAVCSHTHPEGMHLKLTCEVCVSHTQHTHTHKHTHTTQTHTCGHTKLNAGEEQSQCGPWGP